MACLRAGFAHAELDTAAALAVATAQGVPAPMAAHLLADFTAGMLAGIAARRAQQDESPPP